MSEETRKMTKFDDNHLKRFDDFFTIQLKPKLREKYSNIGEPCILNVIERFEKMIDYNVPHGKKLRGLCVYESLCILNNLPFTSNDESLNNAIAIGWCIEVVSLFFF
jgi:farnesyl diphosphate synthase